MRRCIQLTVITTALCVVYPPLSIAQNLTTVTATVVDPNGTVYINGSYSIIFYNPTTRQATYGGIPLQPSQMSYTGQLDASGHLSVKLPSNATIDPSGTQWTFKICANGAQIAMFYPPPTLPCFSSTQTISGASQVVTFTAAVIPTYSTAGGGVAGSNTQVQFNDAGSFGGDAGLTYDKATKSLVAGGGATSDSYLGANNNFLEVLSGGVNVDATSTGGVVSIFTASGNVTIDPGASKDLTIGGPSQSNSGHIKIQGSGSGSATIGVADVAGSPNRMNLPTTTGTNGQCLQTNGANPQQLSWSSCGVAGSNTQIQFNDAGVFGGDANLTWSKATGSFVAVGGATATSLIALGPTTQNGLSISPTLSTFQAQETNADVLISTNRDILLQPALGKVKVGTLAGGSPSQTGVIAWLGRTSGSADIGVADVAGTPNRLNLPTATGAPGALLVTNGGNPQQLSWTGNCSSSASPAVCGSAAAGSVAVPTGTNPTLVVNTTAVTANSQILLQSDDTLGTKLSVTCNSTLTSLAVEPVVTARSAGTSFTITMNGVISTNPVCLSYLVVN